MSERKRPRAPFGLPCRLGGVPMATYQEQAPKDGAEIIGHVEHMGWPVHVQDLRKRVCGLPQLAAMLIDDAHLQRQEAEVRAEKAEAKLAALWAQAADILAVLRHPATRGVWRSRELCPDGQIKEGWSVTFVRDGDYCELPYASSPAEACRVALRLLGEEATCGR